MECPICGGNLNEVFTTRVIQKYSAQFTLCDRCGFLKISNPHWLQEAYTSAIASTDTGLAARNLLLAEKLAATLFLTFGERGDGHYLDIAGGFGLLTRLMRDYGFNFYWQDKYCANLMAPGFEFERKSPKCNAVTAFEVIEHLEDPASFVKDALEQSGADTFIFSTALFNGPPPQPHQWWFYSLDTGQHISFFQERTLIVLAEQLGMRFFASKPFFIFSKKTISPLALELGTSRASPFVARVARKRLGSKTMPDHEEMVARLRNQTEKCD